MDNLLPHVALLAALIICFIARAYEKEKPTLKDEPEPEFPIAEYISDIELRASCLEDRKKISEVIKSGNITINEVEFIIFKCDVKFSPVSMIAKINVINKTRLGR
jgi:hypothetical protein